MGFVSRQNVDTDFTKTVHRASYARISIDRPELSQAGKTVLVTGGATGIGFSIAQSFLKSGAKRIVIVGRRRDVLDTANEKLTAMTKDFKAPTEVITMSLDQTDRQAVQAFWADMTSRGILVDVLILNAASFSEELPLLELGAEKLWSAYETNVRGLLDMLEGINKQPSDTRRVCTQLEQERDHESNIECH